MRKKVLIITQIYEPGFKGGGPIQSIKNLVENLSDELDIYILTSDRDLGDTTPYPGIKRNEWVEYQGAKVYYSVDSWKWIYKLRDIIQEGNFDYIYLNSFFSLKYSIYPVMLKKIGLLPNNKFIIAPRGEFSPGALKLKRNKKRIFIIFSNLARLHHNMSWHATSEIEKAHIYNNIAPLSIKIISNLTKNYTHVFPNKRIKKQGELNIIFLSRIHPKKNLKYAIKILKKIKKGQITFNVYGPIEDQEYWSTCLDEVRLLPSNITFVYHGEVENKEVSKLFTNHHLFLFPTFGENFGHVIAESLLNGCLTLTSDETPWNNMADFGAGADFPLKNESEFVDYINTMVDMDESLFEEKSKNAMNYARKILNTESVKKDYINLFS